MNELNEKKNKTEKILNNIINLPAFPEIVSEIALMCDDPTISISSMVRVISKDQGIAFKLLSVANSPLYGLPRKVATLEFAILLIGFQETKNIVLAISLMEAFKIKDDAHIKFKDLYTHAYLTATLAKRITEDLRFKFSNEAFVAGLLHDLGIAIIHRYFHSAFLKIIDEVVENNLSFTEVELNELGMTHSDIGKFLAEKYNFAPILVDSILFHHNPEHAVESKTLASLVHLADFTVNFSRTGFNYWDKDLEIDDKIIDILEFSNKEAVIDFLLQYQDLLQQEQKLIVI
ncbi:MAG: HDOD domain-containing protein [Ignavibacterium sp.]